MDDHCHVDPIEKTATAEELESTTTAYLAISGMGCPRCAMRVRNSLFTVHGISDATIDHLTGMGKVVFAPGLTSISAIVEAVARAGNDGQHKYWAVLLGQAVND